MSEEMIFEGQLEKDAVRAACEKLLVEPKMVVYEVLESRDATKTRFRTSRAYCKIQVKEVKSAADLAPRPKAPKSEPAQNKSERRERAPRREDSRERPANDRSSSDSRGSKSREPRRERVETPLDPEVVARSGALAVEMVSNLLERMGFEAHVTHEENDQRVFVQVKCDDETLLEHADGRVLESLQYLANASINWKQRGKRVVVEQAGAREAREAELTALAESLAKKVIETGEEMRLQPMHSADRRHIHQALNEMEGVDTKSEGTGGFRCIRIVPA